MKTYKIFVGLFVLLLVIYIVAEVNKPVPKNWTITLSKTDKNPYGAYILFNRLKDIFPSANINSYREPIYNRLHENEYYNTAYILLAPQITTDTLDVADACKYVEDGNYMFISAYQLSKKMMDTLGISLNNAFGFNPKDSTVVNFTNSTLKTSKGFSAGSTDINGYFDSLKKPDSTTILGVNNHSKPNFIRVDTGEGAFFIHTAPLCFSNYFMLQNNNVAYTSKALSYLPKDVESVMWDEYYKAGRGGPATPLRFFLTNTWLRWALWLSVGGMVLFVLFDMKRRQRIIPVVLPLRNATLDFVKTIAGVYYNQKDNKAIAEKKIHYWLEFIRQRFYISTQYLNQEFVETVAKKSGVSTIAIEAIINYAAIIQSSNVPNKLLIEINAAIDEFYKQAK